MAQPIRHQAHRLRKTAVRSHPAVRLVARESVIASDTIALLPKEQIACDRATD